MGRCTKTGILSLIFIFYTCVVCFSQGISTELIAPAKMDGKWGYINNKGAWVVAAEYIAAKNFDHNLGEVIYYESEADDYRTKFIDSKNQTVFRLPELNYSEFSEGFLAYKEGDFYGYIDSSGSRVIPAQFKFCSPFKSGRAAVIFKSGKSGYINYSKQLLISPRYDTAFDFRDKFAVVGKKDKVTAIYKYGVIDTYGNIIVPFIYDYISNFSESKAFGNKGGKLERGILTGGMWFIINLEQEKTQPIEDSTLVITVDNSGKHPWMQFHNGVSWFPGKTATGKIAMGLINADGKWVLKPKFSVVNMISEGMAGVFEGKMGFVDLKGSMVIPCRYDVVSDFHNGLARVKIGAKFGFINKSGDLVIKAEFEDAGDFVGVK